MRFIFSRYLWIITILLSMAAAEIITAIMGLLLRGNITYDYLVTALVVDLFLTPPVVIAGILMQRRMQNLEKCRQEEVAKNLELSASKQRYRTFIEVANDAILVAAAKTGSLVDCNRQAEILLGRSRSDIVGQHLIDLYKNASASANNNIRLEPRAFIRRLLNERMVTTEFSMIQADGTTIFVESSSNIFEMEGRRYIHFALRDISERKRAEKRLRLLANKLQAANKALQEAHQQKNEFLAMLSHELRNPLAPIRNAVQIMHKLDAPDPKLKWVRNVVDRQVNHLARLVDDLLDVSRIVQGKLTLQKTPMEVATLIDQAIEISQPLMDSRHHIFTVSISREDMRLEGDSMRLTQVVSNLLDNAAKYTPKGGHIWLTAACENGEAVISVRDTGEGIASALLLQLFDVFTQAERTLDRSQGGLGLGLTIAKRIVELHGGRIEAHSEGLKRGSEFVVWLPLCKEDVTRIPRLQAAVGQEGERASEEPIQRPLDSTEARITAFS